MTKPKAVCAEHQGGLAVTKSSLQAGHLTLGRDPQVPRKDGIGGRQRSGDIFQGRDSTRELKDQLDGTP